MRVPGPVTAPCTETDGSPAPAYTMAQLHELTGFPEVWEFEKRFAET